MWTWMVDFFREGGPVMFPLTAASILAVAIIIERGIGLRRSKVISPMLSAEIERLRPGESPARLAASAETDKTPLGAVVRVALNHLEWPRSENADAIQTRARSEVVKLEHGLVALEVITGVSPLLGLLGTLGGLKYLFKDIGHIATEGGTTGLGIGISHALNCTFFGLLIAIIALIGWSYFNRKIERMLAEMESMMSDLLTKLYREKANG
ncbi:MAG: MotA/TolQ/ExbB proton channel family protein [Verrucomicrobiae bacterium]|nr:MotA/TolQ/ExbB proton channel family protein [Verrucomicrobiae bacterium]